MHNAPAGGYRVRVMNLQPFRVSNDALADPAELRRRFEDEGYLFLRKFQDPDKLRQLRLDILETLQRAGDWIVPGSRLEEGRVDPDKAVTEGNREYSEVYAQVQKLRSMHASGHWPEVVDVVGQIIDGPVMPHPMKITRLWFPKYTEHTTPFHQDFVHFQSNLEVISVWTPVGDCPLELGPLAVVEGSHKVGRVVDHHFSLGAGGQKVADPEQRGIPRCSDFEIGDTLIFGCLMVHGALPNLTEDRLRVSLDNRYQLDGLPVSENQLKPHLVDILTWEQVYEDWPEDDPLKYYWRSSQFEVIEQDTRFGEVAFAEALELAEQGDEHALIALKRAVANSPNAESVEKAHKILEKIGALETAPGA